MKIHNRIAIDIATGRVIESESFDYRGPVAQAKGGGDTTTTTSTALPAWLQPYAEQFIGAYKGQVFDESGNIKQQPEGITQQVAGFDPSQQTAMNNIAGMTGGVQNAANMGLNQANATLGGAYLNPASNPYLNDTYKMAASGMTQQFRDATAPGIMALAQKSGNFGGSAMGETLGTAATNFQGGLNDLATKIYGGNYSAERANQLNTLNMLPNTMAAAYMPQQNLMGVGAQRQQQEQTQMDTDYFNTVNKAQFPFEMLSGFGGALGQAGMGSGNSKVQTSGAGGK